MSIQNQNYFSVPCYEYKQEESSIRSYNPFHTDFQLQGKSHNIIPLTQKKSNNNSIRFEDDKSFITKNQLDLSQTLQQKTIQKLPIVVKNYRSLIPAQINKKVKSGVAEITVYYFNTTKKIVFLKSQISKKFALAGEQSMVKQLPLVKFLIPYLVKQYCQLFLNFQPLEVNYEYFQLKLAGLNYQDDPLIEPFSHQEEINWLFQCGNLVLVRKQKDYERLKIWQKKIANDMEVLQIIIPFQRQIIQQVQKNKSLSSLKQKLMSYNQFGNIVIVTYSSFTVCDFKKKIAQIVTLDRILQVYRLETTSFEDVDNKHQQKQKNQLMKQQPILQPKQNSRNITDAQFEVSQNFYSGKLYIQILGTKIIQKYEGGIMSYIIANQRRIQRSIHTLIGISCQKTTIKLKFLTKAGGQTCVYQFQSKSQVQTFFKCILRIGRQLKQNFQKISK